MIVRALSIPVFEGREEEKTGRLADVGWPDLGLKDTERSVVDIFVSTS